ncbi:MAG: two-component sensor histidine kinase [Thermoleophilia bacterium]|nr:two-component sensor histidine kinase [Thermoleophilia bacterium]
MRHRFRPGLTTRLALVGVVSALLPFLVGLAILLAVPQRISTRQVDTELQHAAALGAARLQSRRADLAFALASVDQRQLRADVVAGRAGAIRDDVRERWGAITGESGDDVVVELRDATPQRTEDGATATYLLLDQGSRTIGVAVREVGGDDRILRATADDTDVRLQLETVDARPERDDDSRWVVAPIDAARALEVRATVVGSPIEMILRARGGELRAALALLLAAGLLCAVAIALVMNRMLRTVAVSAERMAGGDFGTRLPVVGADAGARVAGSLNELASELQARIGALEHSVDQLDRTLEGIEDGVCAWTVDGEISTWNAAATTLAHADPTTTPGAAAATVDALRLEQAPGRRRVLLPIGDGTRSVVVELFVRRMADGGVLQVFRDATPALSIEQARKNFLVTAAHELRTPLTSILGFAATLADDSLELTPEVRRMALAQVLDEAERLDTVVDSLFESSLLARDKLAVSIGRVPLPDVVAEAMQSADVLDVDVSGIDDAADARADRRALVRVIGSLLDNAVKYGQAPVRVATRVVDQRVHIEVSDCGAGIPAESHDAVFEPFFRIDPDMRTDVGGAGMGLYTARRLVEAMGGSLAVANGGDGGGARLTIVLAVWPDAGRASTDDDSGRSALSA